MILTYQEHSTLTMQSNFAATGQLVILQPELFQKLMILAQQAEAKNSGGVNVYIPFENSHN